MSDIIQCPMCAEDIKAAAKKCKHCGEFLSSPEANRPVNPTSSAEFGAREGLALVLFLGGLFVLVASISSGNGLTLLASGFAVVLGLVLGVLSQQGKGKGAESMTPAERERHIEALKAKRREMQNK